MLESNGDIDADEKDEKTSPLNKGHKINDIPESAAKSGIKVSVVESLFSLESDREVNMNIGVQGLTERFEKFIKEETTKL